MAQENEKRDIYILLSYTGSLFAKGIKAYMKVPYTHVSIGLDEQLNELYSFGRKHPKIPFWGGFVKENVNTGQISHLNKAFCTVYRLSVDITRYKKVVKNINYFKSLQNLKYNFLGILGIVIGKPIYRERAYFCSQFVATILELSDISLFQKEPGLVTPKDFMDSQALACVYQGIMNKYCGVGTYQTSCA